MKKYTLYIILSIVVVGLLVVYPYYRKIFAPNVKTKDGKDYELLIPSGMDYIQVGEKLRREGVIVNAKSFHWVAEKMNYPRNVHPGRYIVEQSMSNRELIKLLRSGSQTPVDFTFVKFRTTDDLIDYSSDKLAFSGGELKQILKDEAFLSEFGLTPQTAVTIFIPNTYKLYWTISAEQFVRRMYKEYRRFWNDARKAKRQKYNLSRLEVMTIASIVEEETQKNDEKSRVAGVYFNRIRKKWPLEADPTVKYAVGDFALKRILHIHLETDSPYNTYKYPGIPPGPICTPSTSTIDAVLNAEKHDFMFFCANYDMSGYHHFSKTLGEHNAYAKLYHQKLNTLGIH